MFSRLRLLDDLPRLVEPLQGEQVVGEILVATTDPGQRGCLAG